MLVIVMRMTFMHITYPLAERVLARLNYQARGAYGVKLEAMLTRSCPLTLRLVFCVS